MIASHGSCQQLLRSLFAMALSCHCFGPMKCFARAAYSMTIRTTSKTITFYHPFWLKGVDRELPPGDYRVTTEEELIEGLSFSAYHRVSTVIFVPAPSGSAVEMVTIDPADLEAARERDTAKIPEK